MHKTLPITKLIMCLLAALIILVSTSGCSSSNNADDEQTSTLVVFAASSLTNAFSDLASAFEETISGVTVIINFASSSQLAAQIIEGAGADIFASANEIQMQVVVDAGRAATTPILFTSNRLTIVVPHDNPGDIQSHEDLARPGIVLILAAPNTPIRVYSDQVIGLLGDETFQNGIYANLVSEEVNVRQVVTKIALGEADAGLVYISDLTPDIAGKLLQIPIPEEFNTITAYPIAVLRASKNPELAQLFIDFVLSREGQTILMNWGFGTIQ
jgi:molybdate transport system substrate-binding protein